VTVLGVDFWSAPASWVVDDAVLPGAPLCEELAWLSSAAAMAGLLAIAAPIPSATASPPTLPMNRPYEYGVVATLRVLSQDVC